MTTVAYDGTMVAGDTLVTNEDGTIGGHAIKVGRRGPVLAAFMGSTADGQGFLDWFAGGMKAEKPPTFTTSATGALLLPDRMIVEWTQEGWSRFRAPIWVGGSGGDVAMGAMLAGKTAEEAVRLAMRYDTRTGGRVICLRR